MNAMEMQNDQENLMDMHVENKAKHQCRIDLRYFLQLKQRDRKRESFSLMSKRRGT